MNKVLTYLAPRSPSDVRVADRAVLLSRILRGIGAIALVGSAATFLVQRWGVASDIQRYLGLLGLTVALPFLAFICGIGLKEGRGARVFMGSLLSIIPVHFGVLGGLLYSQFQWFSTVQTTPAYALWEATGPFSAAAIALGAVVVLIPLTIISFVVMARPQFKILSLVYLGANGLLLVPTRHATVIAGLATALIAVLLLAELRVFRHKPNLSTTEGIWVRVLFLAPLTILLVRQIHLYPLTPLFGLVLWSCLAIGLFVAGSAFENTPRKILRRISLLPFAIAWCSLALLLGLEKSLHEGAFVLVAGIPIALFTGGLSLLEQRDRSFYRTLAGAVAGLTAAIGLLVFPCATTSLSCITVGVIYVAAGFLHHRWWLLGIGLVGVLGASIFHIQASVEAFQWSGWGGLAALGISVIVAASVLERFYARVASQQK